MASILLCCDIKPYYNRLHNDFVWIVLVKIMFSAWIKMLSRPVFDKISTVLSIIFKSEKNYNELFSFVFQISDISAYEWNVLYVSIWSKSVFVVTYSFDSRQLVFCWNDTVIDANCTKLSIVMISFDTFLYIFKSISKVVMPRQHLINKIDTNLNNFLHLQKFYSYKIFVAIVLICFNIK